jgi:hypothetical protein
MRGSLGMSREFIGGVAGQPARAQLRHREVADVLAGDPLEDLHCGHETTHL